jgi:uncharacterized membrane protein YkvA (DUF1232 family)
MNIKPSFWRMLPHLPRLVRLILRLIRDSRVPVFAKIVFFFGIAYTLWPVDLIPDLLLPVVGYSDDVAVLLLCARYLFYRTPPEVLEEHLYALEAGRE